MAEYRPWTEEDDETLRRARKQGLSWGKTAKRLRRGRTQTVEHAKAIGEWKPRETSVPPKAPVREHAPPSELGLLPPPAPRPDLSKPIPPRPDLSKPIPPPRGCQWPLNDGRPWHFCDGALVGRVYCAEHHAMAYVLRAEAVSAEQRA